MADTTKKEDFANDLLPNPDTLEEGIHHVNNPVLDLPDIEKLYLTAIPKTEMRFIFLMDAPKLR